MATLLWIRQGVITGEDAIAQGLLTLEGKAGSQAAVRQLYRFDSVRAGSA